MNIDNKQRKISNYDLHIYFLIKIPYFDIVDQLTKFDDHRPKNIKDLTIYNCKIPKVF